VRTEVDAGLLAGKQEENKPLSNNAHDWKITLKWTVKLWYRMAWIKLIWLSTGTIGDSLEHDNESCGYIKLGESCG
jgi:hypothetical protein